MTAASLEILDRLVAFPTVSSASNFDLVAFVVEFLGARGVEVALVPGGEGAKANLFATIGPQNRGGVML